RILRRLGSPLVPRDTFVVDNVVYEDVAPMFGDLSKLRRFIGDLSDAVEPACLQRVNRWFFRELAEAVASCHSLNIVHCDLKDSNVLVELPAAPGAPARLHLADFEFAEERASFPLRDGMGGTYRAPEQVLSREGTPLDGKIDVFCHGVSTLLTLADARYLPEGVLGIGCSNQGLYRGTKLYARWRAARSLTPDADGPLSWHKVRTALGGRFVLDFTEEGLFRRIDRFVQQAFENDATLTTYVLDHMLRIRPENRDDAAAVWAAASGLSDPADDPEVADLIALASGLDATRHFQEEAVRTFDEEVRDEEARARRGEQTWLQRSVR
ncbi:MAG TPA: hypothetical protein VFH51_07220, partial [Myxococcota bacterium]|nr:hypothetical protein [Myxococcota bacterium]